MDTINVAPQSAAQQTKDNILEMNIIAAFDKTITTRDFKSVKLVELKGFIAGREVKTTVFLNTKKQEELLSALKHALKLKAEGMEKNALAKINVYASETHYTNPQGESVEYKYPRLKASFVAVKF